MTLAVHTLQLTKHGVSCHHRSSSCLTFLSSLPKVLMFEDPHDTPLVEWRHDRVGCAVLEFQSGQCHSGSSPRHLLGRIQRELPADIAVSHKCMQEGDQEEEEPLPLFYQVPLPRLLSWSRWWHITSRTLLIAYQKRFWALDRKLPEAISRCGESSSRPRQELLERQGGDVERKDHRLYRPQHRCHCQGSKEPVILRVNTPMTLPEKKKRRGRD